jgi:hypothetical protein
MFRAFGQIVVTDCYCGASLPVVIQVKHANPSIELIECERYGSELPLPGASRSSSKL